MANFLTLPLFKELILPFVLIFVLIFAILQKSKLLGDGKTQVDALIGFVVAALLVGFSQAVDYIAQFTVFLSVGLVILFVFLMLFGFARGTGDGDPLKALKLQYWILGIIFVAVIVGALIITNTWGTVSTFFTTQGTGQNLLFLVLIIAAVIAVVFSGKSGSSKPSNS
ncbi:hypothetical protein FJZ17_00190 [Candidatus Pacearchaeota archaeon]|nr:hypothetical protein [Candidatus Pacearchaeota archaeon]